MRLPVVALAAVMGGTGCIDLVGADARFVERETKHFSTSGTPDIHLDTFDGAIEIRAWDKPDVEVVIEKRAVNREAAATIDVRAEQSGNRVTVEAKTAKPGGIGFHINYSRSAKLIVSAPANSNLAARSGDGSIDIEHMTGRLELRSGDGSIHGRDLSGEVNVHTGDGSIRIDGVKGSLDLDTGDGTIVASGTLTAVRARSGDGGVTIRADSGSVPSGDWEITTGDGSITLEVADTFNANLDAHTGDGGISIRDLTVSNVGGKIARNNLRGQLGSGGPQVRLRTGDGGITLRRALAAERGTP
jgi:DUF4097 and DUF4098 domain-containing protein YvlB